MHQMWYSMTQGSQQDLCSQQSKRALNQWSAVLLTGALSVSLGLFVLPSMGLADTAGLTTSLKAATLADQRANNEPLPQPLANRLRQDLSKRTGIATGKLRVVEATRKTWSNGCLGLANSNEFCTEALIDGWRVVLTDGYKRWIYRTDRQGGMYRLESPTQSSSSPRTSVQPPVKPTVLRIAQRPRGHQPVNQPVSNVKPTPILASELPPALETKAVFRAISSGGFIGRTYQTTLLNDGRVVRVLVSPAGGAATPEVHQVSLQRVRQFQQLLNQQGMKRFDRLNYPAVPGSADYITVTLSSRTSTLRYADTIQDQLPSALKTIIQSWTDLTRTS